MSKDNLQIIMPLYDEPQEEGVSKPDELLICRKV